MRMLAADATGSAAMLIPITNQRLLAMITIKTGFGSPNAIFASAASPNVARTKIDPYYNLKTSKAYPVALINKDSFPRLEGPFTYKHRHKRYNDDKKQPGDEPAEILDAMAESKR